MHLDENSHRFTRRAMGIEDVAYQLAEPKSGMYMCSQKNKDKDLTANADHAF